MGCKTIIIKDKGYRVGWLVFYVISTIVGYFIHLFYLDALYVNSLSVTLFSNKLLELICLCTVKWFQVLLTLTILFNINHLLAKS